LPAFVSSKNICRKRKAKRWKKSKKKRIKPIVDMEPITAYLTRTTLTEPGTVRVWEEEILLPTYPVGEEEKNPVFLEKRVYQGSSGAVYPYPVIEKIADEKVDKPYRAFFVENDYLKIMVLPALGGRVQMAYDKIKNRHFVYYNQVIKPALVGLTGPWISGGIEFNWPQHHRPSTFLPVDCSIEEHADGSKTIWCSEVERMSRTKGMHGFTLRPGKARLEINVQIYNRTPFPQTFLWWANPAVVVHEQYHSVFPPDVHAVFDHGKRDVSRFPIATGTYYKQDYSAGVDISRYQNIPVPTSYMAIQSKFDFVGGYEENVRGGLLHVANHHVAPGKKQWTWGCGDFGRAWDRNLTDEDGPYIELMTGVYTDNQPDFSWLQPYEEKSWTQYFMPYAELGYVKNATKDALVNLETHGGQTEIMLYTTARFASLQAMLKHKNGALLFSQKINASPAEPYKALVPTGDALPEELRFELRSEQGQLLLEYQAEAPALKPLPEPAQAAKAPQEVASVEQLFLTGLHLEQYRHATYFPMDYYLEALRREPGDVRCNNAAGLWFLRRGQFAKAETHFRTAIGTLTARNPNPYDGEPYYHLGLSLKMQRKNDEACDAFFKATWNVAWQDPAYFSLAQIDTMYGRFEEALDRVERSLIRNAHNHKARHLKAIVLRKLGRTEEALRWIEASLQIDRFNVGCLFEKDARRLPPHFRCTPHDFLEYAFDYAAAGLYDEAEQLLLLSPDTRYPILFYALASFASLSGKPEKAAAYSAQAARLPAGYCFPNRIEEVNLLQEAIDNNPADAKAPYYLGNFWYAARQYPEAIACWERSAALDATFPTVLRNLALAYYNQLNEKEKAGALLEKAFALDESDARLFMERDQLYKKRGLPVHERLAFLEKHLPLVEQRDDLSIERITLYNQAGEYEKARELLAGRQFHPWEGGEGKVTGQYVVCHLELAKRAIAEQQYDRALRLLEATEAYPPHLGEGKLANAEENDVDYYKGIAFAGLGDASAARLAFERATCGSSEPQQAFFYNDNQPDKIFYQGLAWRRLGRDDRARGCFNKLIAYGEKHLFDTCRIDYFAVSLPDLAIWDDDLSVRNQIHCYYMMGLGYLGLGDKEKARAFLSKVSALDVNHLGAQIHLS
jgi:tetratricopeptide (TPR) repeat protein